MVFFGHSFHELNGIPEDSTPTLQEVDPRELVHWKRLDLIPKINLAQQLFEMRPPEMASREYREIIRVFSGGTFREPGQESKRDFESFMRAFSELVTSIRQQGFVAEKSVVAVSRDGIPLDGSHRIAAAIACGTPITIAQFDIAGPDYGFSYFLKGGVDEYVLDGYLLETMRYRNDHDSFIIWPKKHDETLRQLKAQIQAQGGGILRSQTTTANWPGLVALVADIYRDHHWVGNGASGYRGAQQKALSVFAEPCKVSLVTTTGTTANAVKERVRELHGQGNDTLHSTDTPKESLSVASSLLSPQTRHFLQHGNMLRFPRTLRLIDELRTTVHEVTDAGDHLAVVGSAVLGIYGLRAPNDIDILAGPAVKDLPWPPTIGLHNEYIRYYGFDDVGAFLQDSRAFINLMGLRFQSLESLRTTNLAWPDSSKKRDIALIESAAKNSRVAMLRLRFNTAVHRQVRRVYFSLRVFAGRSKRFMFRHFIRQGQSDK